MSELITVPTFTFNQGKHSNDNFQENPITVSYYHNGINLTQEGEFDVPESIRLSYDHFEKLFKEIKKHKLDAEFHLKR